MIELDPNTLDPVTERDEQQIREAVDTVVVCRRVSVSAGVLHLPHEDHDDTPRCERMISQRRDSDGDVTREFRTVSPEVYPPGHMPICKYCAAEFRAGEQ